MFLKAVNTTLAQIFFKPGFVYLRRAQFYLAVAIFAYFALSSSPLQLVQNTSDKSLHFIGNILLFCSTWVAAFGSAGKLKALAIAVPYSIGIELLQYFSPARTTDPFDAVANLAGITVGFLLCIMFEWYLKQIQNQRRYPADTADVSD